MPNTAMLTPACARALVAVAAGEVTRIYRRNGNVLKGPKGVASSALWRLDRAKLIADGPNRVDGGFQIVFTQVVTKAGEKLYADAGYRQLIRQQGAFSGAQERCRPT